MLQLPAKLLSKKDQYRGKYADAEFNQVVPFAIEASGRLCLEAAAFVGMVVDRAADRQTSYLDEHLVRITSANPNY